MKLPPNLDPDLLVGRPRGARLITDHRFPVSERKLREWPLPWVYIHGRACTTVAALFAEADRIIREASHEPSRDTARARIAARFRRRQEGA